jgi:hypothetical protein
MERGDITDEKINRAWNEYQLARALREAYYERERFRSAHREFKELADSLAAINRGEEITEPAPTKASADRGAAKAALDAVLKFLHRPGHKISVRQRFDSAAVLYRHRIDLDALDHGITPLALKAERKKGGRKRDSAIVQQLKGSLAGIARLQMESGLSRRAAAALVARRIPRPLASRLSSKGFITSRTVLQYMDQYDCGATLLKKFEQPSEREKFKTIFGYREGNDDGSLRQFRAEGRHLLRQINFLKENTPKRKLSGYRKGVWKQANPLTALFGFAREMHLVASARAEGYWPSCDDLFEDLGAFLIASDQ